MSSFLLIVPDFSLLTQPLLPFLSSSPSPSHLPIASFRALHQVVINNLVYTFSLSTLSSLPLFARFILTIKLGLFLKAVLPWRPFECRVQVPTIPGCGIWSQFTVLFPPPWSFQTFPLQPLCKVPVPWRLMLPSYATSFPLYYCCPPTSSSLLVTKVWAPGSQIFMFNAEQVSDAIRIDYVPY